ncbi:MAG TPA: VOC family protein [Ktedonobacteraceae bacterium]|nr:VOC family protein [Ktedonobacteraceae bacterium]
MLIGIDHIIVGVNDLDAAAQRFSEQLGLQASGGGVHPFGGTANRVEVIGDTYLELIAVRVAGEAQRSMVERLAKGEGYLNVALGSDDLASDSEAIRRRGVALIGPTAGQLRAGDGRERGWLRSEIERPDLAQRYPFLIQHDSAGEERRSRLAGWKRPPAHPLGATGVLSATIAVENLQEAARRFAHIYGLEPSIPFAGEADGWDAMLVSFPLGDSGQSLELAEPIPLAAEDDAEIGLEHLPDAGALRGHLARFGESVCRMTLAVESMERARSYLDAHEVTSTYVESERPALWIHPDYACGASIVLREQG